MHIQEEIRGDVAVVTLKGDLLDEEDSFPLQQEVASLKVDGVRKVVFDLKHLNRINSKGLGALITAFKIMREAGGDIRFADIDTHINSIFVKTRLVQVFNTYETVGRALASYSAEMPTA